MKLVDSYMIFTASTSKEILCPYLNKINIK